MLVTGRKVYSRTSTARISLGPWNFVLEMAIMGGLSH